MVNNLKIAFLGDSITEGIGASCIENCYVRLVSKILNCEVKNYGISGTRIAKQQSITQPHSYDMFFGSRLDFIDSDIDLIFVFGGANDYMHGDALFGQDNDKTNDTFCGALNLLIKNLIKKFGKEKIVFLLPTRFYDEKIKKGKIKFCEYVRKIKEKAEENDVKYIDLYHKAYAIPKKEGNSKFSCDGIHPNDNGYKRIADLICEWIKNNKKEFFND